MTADTRSTSHAYDVETRARNSLGISKTAVYEVVRRALLEARVRGGTVVDVGCGTGSLRPFIADQFDRYIGVDVVRYAGFPAEAEFHLINLDTGAADLGDHLADLVVAVETIEHLENPRAFVRELARLAKPGGWICLTTPNQESLLSLASLVMKRQFVAFQDTDYPAHVTALLEMDLCRIATECGMGDIRIRYSLEGRLALTAGRYPRWLTRAFPRLGSDNVLMLARKPLARE